MSTPTNKTTYVEENVTTLLLMTLFMPRHQTLILTKDSKRIELIFDQLQEKLTVPGLVYTRTRRPPVIHLESTRSYIVSVFPQNGNLCGQTADLVVKVREEEFDKDSSDAIKAILRGDKYRQRPLLLLLPSP